MRDLHQMEDSVLIDLLAEYTLQFTQLFRIYKEIHSNKEYQNCKKMIEKIIGELESRGLVPQGQPPESATEKIIRTSDEGERSLINPPSAHP
jgi:hypothetical protein